MVGSTPRRVVLCALGAAVICSAAAVGAARVRFPLGTGLAAEELPGVHLIQAWARWDAGWYAAIARDGYWYNPGAQSPVAFFPAYPLAIRGISSLGFNRYVSGVLLTWLCGLLGLWLFARWAQEVAGERIAFRASLLLLAYPFSLYLYGAMYSDALFLVLVAGAFLALERDRVLLATLLGAAATAARPVAPAVVLGLLVRRLEQRHARSQPITLRDFTPLLSAAGMALYMAFLWHRFGDPLAFAHVESAPGWDHTPELATWLKFTWFRTLATSRSIPVDLRLIVHALAAVYALLLVVPTCRMLGWGYALYIAAVVGIPFISSKDLVGMGRYLIAAFPCFLTLALLMKDRPRLAAGWLAVSALMLIALSAAFGATVYVA